jgi:hypothetical protein
MRNLAREELRAMQLQALATACGLSLRRENPSA